MKHPYLRSGWHIRVVNNSNCLATVNPTIAKEWHPTFNSGLTPFNFTESSGIEVWWICKNKHEWLATISTRTKGHGCPYCYGRKACKENSFATIHPELLVEWNVTRNLPLTPDNSTYSSGKKVWWICHKCQHNWSAKINDRHNNHHCPKCAKSKNEQKIHNFLVDNDVEFIPQHRFKDCRDKLPLPFDFYLPKKNMCIEYDGEQHFIKWRFSNKKKAIIKFNIQKSHDKTKTEYCTKNDIILKRIKYDQDVIEVLKFILA